MKQSQYDCKNKNQAGRVVKNFPACIDYSLSRKSAIDLFSYAAGIFHSFRRTNFVEKSTCNSKCFFMVEMAVIETASEKGSPQLSTGVACLLRFPRRSAARQAHRFGSSVVHDGLRSTHPCTFTANRRLVPGRSTPGKDGCYLSSL